MHRNQKRIYDGLCIFIPFYEVVLNKKGILSHNQEQTMRRYCDQGGKIVFLVNRPTTEFVVEISRSIGCIYSIDIDKKANCRIVNFASNRATIINGDPSSGIQKFIDLHPHVRRVLVIGANRDYTQIFKKYISKSNDFSSLIIATKDCFRELKEQADIYVDKTQNEDILCNLINFKLSPKTKKYRALLNR